MVLEIYVQPNSRKVGFAGYHGSRLKIKVRSAPEDNKANDELIDYLSQQLKIAKNKITILSGHKHRLKKIEIPSDAPLDLLFSVINN